MSTDRRHSPHPASVALLSWNDEDGLARVLAHELEALGCELRLLTLTSPLPTDVSVLLTFGPFGRLLPFLAQLDRIPPAGRPLSIHWNTEGMPDLRLPRRLSYGASLLRSAAERWLLGTSLPSATIDAATRRFIRFRYVGDLYYAYRRGWVQVVADMSQIYAAIRTGHGLPTSYVPWGSPLEWYESLKLERDIDVLWMGKRATSRRSRLLDHVRDELRRRGRRIHIADNVESPFIFDDERTHYLNRARITLNLTRTWYDDNYMRFAMAAPNRSLIVSETLLPHCPDYVPGVHYISVPTPELVDTILYYLDHESERERIADNGYALVTGQLTLRNSVRRLLTLAGVPVREELPT